MGQGQQEEYVLVILSLLGSGDCCNTCHKSDKTQMRQNLKKSLSEAQEATEG